MPLAAGARLGSYEVLGKLGEGGMGEVYRARDPRLNRSVAIKVLAPLVARDPERLTRFAREAQVLASLNHPNIAQIYGFEHGALIMELVEGPTLADRLARGPIPIDEAIAIARQIADALDAAHAQGIVHRDLKPANVKVREDGTVKVLDFGLAKLAGSEPGKDGVGVGPGAANSPTFTSPGTQIGIILGTAAYMAPEQAKGKTVDKRADIWAFGVVLYEMLAGKPLFEGETISDVLAAVLKDEPDWSGLPAATPPSIRRLLTRTVERDPKKRLHDIADARLELEDVETPARAAASAPVRPRPSIVPAIAVAALAGGVATALGFVLASRWSAAPPVRAVRLSVLASPGEQVAFESAESAIAPDGRSVAFTSMIGNDSRLSLRPLDASAPRPLAGTEHGGLPFWSPDSTRIGFFAEGKLKTIALANGGVTVLCDAPDSRGGTWNAADVIVFAPSNAGALMRVSAQGGDPRPATTLDTSRKETAHRFPSFLPDGTHFLFIALPRPDGRYGVFAGSLDGGPPKELVAAASAAVYAPPGYLLFMRPNGLAAQRFDAGRLELSGDPILLADAPAAVGGRYSGSRPVSVATTGTMAYVGGQIGNTRLVWVDPVSGRELGALDVSPGYYNGIGIAPDGRYAAVVKQQTTTDSDIWLIDLQNGGMRQFTNTPGGNAQPLWSPDGARLAFVSSRSGRSEFYVKPINGSAPETLLYGGGATFKSLHAWSRDGKSILFSQLDPVTGQDLWILPIDGGRAGEPVPYIRTPFAESNASLSPDGRWAAYESFEGGRQDLWVDSFPNPGERHRVTTGGTLGGGFQRNGQFAYMASDFTIYAATPLPGKQFRLGPARPFFTVPTDMVSLDAMPDLSKLLMSVPVDRHPVSSLTVVSDWSAALKKPSPR